MSSSASSSSRRLAGLCRVLALACLWGCAAVRPEPGPAPGPAPEPSPPLAVEAPRPDRVPPQAAGAATVRWEASASGGQGERVYEFLLAGPGDRERSVQTGREAAWSWTPSEAGIYRLSVRVRDARGAEARSAWSETYEVVPPLRVEGLVPDRAAPQAALTSPVLWEARVTGGVGERTYEFEVQDTQGRERAAYTGPSSRWAWTALRPGSYRARVAVQDRSGNRAEGPWSEPYEVVPPLRFTGLAPDRPSPQTEGTPVVWTASAADGVGEKTFRFEAVREDGTADRSAAELRRPWTWTPRRPGAYRVRAVARDAAGNLAEGEWVPYEVAEALKAESPAPDKPAPQAALTAIRWTVAARGGVPPLRYELRLSQGEQAETTVYAGAEPSWEWTPRSAGAYRLRALVTDSRGNRFESPWSAPYAVVPPVAFTAFKPEQPSPQMVGTTVSWDAQAGGGVGALTYDFFVKGPKGGETLFQSGPSPVATWTPTAPGDYQVRVRASDTLGNAAERRWPGGYSVVAELTLFAFGAEPASPQPSFARVFWQARVEGGVRPLTYAFETRWKGGPPQPGQTGPQDSWEWRPVAAGSHEVRVIVTDNRGHVLVGPWSPPYVVEMPRVAVLPFQNLSGDPVPLKELRDLLAARLQAAGPPVVEEGRVEDLMAALRMRFTGGFEAPLAKGFREQLGAQAVLVTTVEAFQERDGPPRLSLLSRLVSTEETPTVLWSDRVARRGDESPGILGLGVVLDPARMREMAVGRLVGSLGRLLSEGIEHPTERSARDGRLQPRHAFRSPSLSARPEYTVAVLPFFNWTLRRNGGDLLGLHFVNQLANRERFSVIEPGVVRHKLLNFRFVMDQGIALSDVDTVGNSLGADLVVTGTVREYEEPTSAGGEPKVDVTVQLTDVRAKKVVWASRSYATGREGVYFYDWRAFDTASEMVAGMVGAIADRAVENDGKAKTEAKAGGSSR